MMESRIRSLDLTRWHSGYSSFCHIDRIKTLKTRIRRSNPHRIIDRPSMISDNNFFNKIRIATGQRKFYEWNFTREICKRIKCRTRVCQFVTSCATKTTAPQIADMILLISIQPQFSCMSVDKTQDFYPSGLEELLLNNGNARIGIIEYLDPASIARLARVNTCIHGVITAYYRLKWNVHDMLAHFVCDTEDLLSTLKLTNGLVFGPAVLQFFDRQPIDGNTIHICAPYEHAQELQAYLCQESFFYRSATSPFTPFLQKMAENLNQADCRDHTIEGYYHLDQGDYDSHVYTFKWSSSFRRVPPKIIVVELHLVRCDPIQHILAFHSSEYINGCQELKF